MGKMNEIKLFSEKTCRHYFFSVVVMAFISSAFSQRHDNHYGRLIGELKNQAHGIGGTVYAVSDEVLFVKGFTYDGTGPDAYFWAGNSSQPNPSGMIIPFPADYNGREPPILRRFDGENVLLKLPLGIKVRDLRWLSVWCRRFTVDFGSVLFPSNLDPPKPRVLSEFKRLAHGLRSGNIKILDSKTFYIPNLHYDGAAPDAFFWVGNGSEPNPQGIKVPNELGTLDVLRGYQGDDIEIQLPGTMTVYDIDWLAMWCITFRENFGHVMIPKDLEVPPALGQTKLTTLPPVGLPSGSSGHQFDSCIQLLNGRMQVQWEAVVEGVIIRLSAEIGDNEYMAFGISGDDGRTQMIGADVTVAYYDKETGTFQAHDYYISDKSQCDGSRGVCPDSRIGGRNDVSVLSGERVKGITSIVFQRSLTAHDDRFDKAIPSVGRVNVIASIGPLNSRKEPNYHSSDRTGPGEDHRIDFTSRGVNQCPTLLAPEISLEEKPVPSTENSYKPWKPNIIQGERTFTARIGPTGGKRGYTTITGHPSWGIAWFINDLLIPEIYVERGQTYTFIVEGGDDPTNTARYHPLYITDSSEGGFGQRPEEQRKQRVFAGVTYDSNGYPFPTAAGHLCEWSHKTIDKWAESNTFEDYKNTLKLECEDNGQPATLFWTVPKDAPNTLYYQCYTHSNLGWKIHVVDPGFRSHQTGNSATILSASFISIVTTLSILLFLRM